MFFSMLLCSSVGIVGLSCRVVKFSIGLCVLLW